MLYAKQDQGILQRIRLLILRKRVQEPGAKSIFYNTDLRRQVLVGINGDTNPQWASSAGLSSQIGHDFTHIPEGMKAERLYAMLGTVISTDPIKVGTVEGTEVANLNPQGLTCSFEILLPDVVLLQEQNQMALEIELDAFVQFNAQDYGQGFDPDGRDREILRGSIWAVPKNWEIGVSRPQPRSAASSAHEVHSIADMAKEKNTQRALSARTESFADRATRDEQRALRPMPPRRGSNTSMPSVQTY